MEYLKELMTQNEQLAATAKLAEKAANTLTMVQNQIAVLEKENAFLRAQIIQFGIDAAASGSQASGELVMEECFKMDVHKSLNKKKKTMELSSILVDVEVIFSNDLRLVSFSKSNKGHRDKSTHCFLGLCVSSI